MWRAIGGAFRVRFGGGAVGRLGQLTIWGGALIVILGIVTIICVPALAPWVLGSLLLFLVLGLGSALIYSLLHPQYAALGDAQMERVMKHDQGARDFDTRRLTPAVEVPTENPLLIDQRGSGGAA